MNKPNFGDIYRENNVESDVENAAYDNGFKTQHNAMNGYYDNPQQVFQQSYNNYRQYHVFLGGISQTINRLMPIDRLSYAK